MTSLAELRDGLPLDDFAEVAALEPSESGVDWNWGLIVALLVCLTVWVGVVVASLHLMLA